jgi:hypothetical protein
MFSGIVFILSSVNVGQSVQKVKRRDTTQLGYTHAFQHVRRRAHRLTDDNNLILSLLDKKLMQKHFSISLGTTSAKRLRFQGT